MTTSACADGLDGLVRNDTGPASEGAMQPCPSSLPVSLADLVCHGHQLVLADLIGTLL